MLIDTRPAIETYAVRLRSRGQVTIPQPVRESLSLNQGAILTVLQLDNAVLFVPQEERTPTLAEKSTQIIENEEICQAN